MNGSDRLRARAQENRCPDCDRPEASPEDWENIPEGEGEHLCWGWGECEAIDWRERCLEAEVLAADLGDALRAIVSTEGLAAIRNSGDVRRTAVVRQASEALARLDAWGQE